MDIGFIGVGKLGMDAAEVMATKHKVCGYDVEPRSSDTICVVPTIKDVVEGQDIVFIAVPTPHSKEYDGSLPSAHLAPKDFDYTIVKECITEANKYMTKDQLLVLISTVLPGTTRREFVPLITNTRFIYNPYLIAMGSVKWDMVNPEMVMIGSDTGSDAAIQELVDIYQPMMQNNPRYVTGTWEECEAIKIFYNTFISAKVGIVNMIQDFAMKIGNINVDVVTDALAASNMRIMGPKYMTAGMGDAGACHPRDNIALRWLAQEYNLGYDMFDTIMQAREIQAKNLAEFLFDTASATNTQMPVVIHGKAYKPNVPYCIGSYSTLIGHYLKGMGVDVQYVDPLADDRTDCVDSVDEPAVILMAHNRQVTYGYTGEQAEDLDYFEFRPGSIIVDPFRQTANRVGMKVIHYGNTRSQ